MMFLMAMLGGFIYRWRGKSHKLKKLTPRPLSQILFALPYAVVCFPVIGWWCVGVLALSTLATLSGHGGFMDLGTWKPSRSDETLEFILKPLKKLIPEYWYDTIGLAVTGIAVTLPAGIVLLNPFIALSGALKAVAYVVAWKLFDKRVATDRAEFLTGLFLWGALFWLI